MILKDEHRQAKDTSWGLGGRIAGRILLVLVPIVSLFLLKAYWAQLIIGAGLALLMRPVRSDLERRLGGKKAWAMALTILLMIVILAALVLLVPAVQQSVQSLSQKMADVAAELTLELANVLDNNRILIIQGVEVDLSYLFDPVINFINQPQEETPAEAAISVIRRFIDAVSQVSSLISLILGALLILVFAIYMLLDMGWLRQGVLFMVSDAYLDELTGLGSKIISIWVAYVRGQLGVMLAIGIVTTAVALVLGLPYALALGAIAALLEIIPHLGPILATIPAVMIALFQGSRWLDVPPLAMAAIVIVAYLGIQQLEDHVFTPNIQGKAVNLPPLLIMLSVLVGMHEFGLLGAILAVPVVASAKELLVYVHAKVIQQDPFPDDQMAPELGGAEPTGMVDTSATGSGIGR